MNSLLQAVCEKNTVLQIGSGIKQLSSSTPPPFVIDWWAPNKNWHIVWYQTEINNYWLLMIEEL